MFNKQQRTQYFKQLDKLTNHQDLARILRRLPMNKQKTMKMMIQGGKLISNLEMDSQKELKRKVQRWTLEVIEEQARQCDMLETICLELIDHH